MHRIEQIRDLVQAHFESFSFLDLEENDGVSAITTRREAELVDEHPAMMILRDLLPLLEAARVIYSDNDYSHEELIEYATKLENEVAKLLTEAQP